MHSNKEWKKEISNQANNMTSIKKKTMVFIKSHLISYSYASQSDAKILAVSLYTSYGHQAPLVAIIRGSIWGSSMDVLLLKC